jgi:hypothetical protein
MFVVGTQLILSLLFLATVTTAYDDGDWNSTLWNDPSVPPVTVSAVGDIPGHPRSSKRGGSGTITIENGEMIMEGRPRYYISNTDHGGRWNNTEFTGTVKTNSTATCGGDHPEYFTMGARSSHDVYNPWGCEAFGYYLSVDSFGKCVFHKEYYHSVR